MNNNTNMQNVYGFVRDKITRRLLYNYREIPTAI